MADLPTRPINRLEQFYNAIATGDASQLPTPITREEAYLAFIAENGGGGGGDWGNASLCGAFCCSLVDTASATAARIGSALSCKPLGESA